MFKAYIYSPDIPVSSADFTLITPQVLELYQLNGIGKIKGAFLVQISP